MIKLLKKYQIGWNNPGQVLNPENRAELHEFIDDLLDAGVNPIVINTQVDAEMGQPLVAEITPIGG